MSSEVDIAAPGIGLPEGDEAEAPSGLWRRTYDNLRTGNLGVVIISHNLIDVFEVADRITVLHLGRNGGLYETAKTSQEEIVRAITLGDASAIAGRAEVTGEAHG